MKNRRFFEYPIKNGYSYFIKNVMSDVGKFLDVELDTESDINVGIVHLKDINNPKLLLTNIIEKEEICLTQNKNGIFFIFNENSPNLFVIEIREYECENCDCDKVYLLIASIKETEKQIEK